MRIENSKKHKMAGGARLLHMAAAVLTAAALVLCCPADSLADTAGTVSVESAKIRKSADTTSDVVGSVARGAKVSIMDEVTDASGTLWYQVYANADTTGYVRADLIQKEAGGDSSTALAASDNGSQTDAAGEDGQQASGAGNQGENTLDAQYAKVSVETAKIRSGPSTNDTVVERLVKDTQVIVSGESNGSSDGKVWYFITFTGADGTEKTGFVRSDLVTLGDMVPVPETEPEPETPAEPEVPETVNQDYEVLLRDGEWYLIDHIAGYEHKLEPLLDAADQLQNDTMGEDAKKLVRQRIAIVVLGVLAAALLIAVIIMAIKLRDAYYEDYEDDEDEEDEEEDDTEDDDEEEEAPVRRRRRMDEEDGARSDGRPPRRSVRDTEPQPSRREQASDPRQGNGVKRKSKNFLLDDDEFEFEFLNMDGKDL